MKKNNIFPLFQKSLVPGKKVIKELFHLALPGMIGGMAAHCSFIIDRGLACYVGNYAVPALNNTERLVYLPVGIVAVALGSVLMTDMSRAAANKNFDEIRDDLSTGLRYIWFFCAPLAIFMILYREPVIRFFFKYGNFTEENVKATADALLFYAMGIPAFCATKVLVSPFYSRKKVKIPFYTSIFCIVLNIPLSILLMFQLKQGGIALATVITAMCNNVLLLYFLKRDSFAPDFAAVGFTMLRSLIFAAAAAYPALHYSAIYSYCRKFTISGIPEAVPLMLCGSFFLITYLLLSMIARSPELREIYSIWRSRKSRKKEV
jgi:putative peptidoglycan lipid II flippase